MSEKNEKDHGILPLLNYPPPLVDHLEPHLDLAHGSATRSPVTNIIIAWIRDAFNWKSTYRLSLHRNKAGLRDSRPTKRRIEAYVNSEIWRCTLTEEAYMSLGVYLEAQNSHTKDQ